MKQQLLLIEDDAALQTLLIDILEHAEYDVAVAMANDYFYMVQEVQPKVLVLGCDGDYTFDRGWEIAATLYRHYPELVMILLSTNRITVEEVGQTSRGKLFAAGLEKPFVIDELLQTIASCYENAASKSLAG